MKLKEFMSTYSGMKKEASLSRIVIIGLLASTGLLSLALVTQEKAVVFEPPMAFDKKMAVYKSSADDTYIELWALALAELLGNADPSKMKFIKEKVALLLHPSLYQDVISKLEVEAQNMKNDNASFTFLPKFTSIDRDLNKVFVFGDQLVRGSDGTAQVSKKITYEFIIDIKNYKPIVMHVNVYEGAPKSANVINKIETAKEREREKNKGDK